MTFPAMQSREFGRKRAERLFWALVMSNRDPRKVSIRNWTDRPPRVCSWYLRKIADTASAERWAELCDGHGRRLRWARARYWGARAAIAVGAAGGLGWAAHWLFTHGG